MARALAALALAAAPGLAAPTSRLAKMRIASMAGVQAKMAKTIDCEQLPHRRAARDPVGRRGPQTVASVSLQA
jgi:hypothetical protein